MRSFSYTPGAGFSEEFLTLLELVLVRNFSYTPRAGFCEEFLLNSSRAGFSEEFLLHSSSWFK